MRRIFHVEVVASSDESDDDDSIPAQESPFAVSELALFGGCLALGGLVTVFIITTFGYLITLAVIERSPGDNWHSAPV